MESAFNLEFYPEHAIGPGGGILIVYPPQTTLGTNQTLHAFVEIEGLIIEEGEGKLDVTFDLSARAISIKNMI